MIYTVSTIDADARITEIGSYPDIERAMKAAKRAARTRSDCEKYGPESICYVGRELTAVIVWH